LRIYRARFLFFVLLPIFTTASIFSQNDAVSPPIVAEEVLEADVLGHGFDLRQVDPKSWATSSKGRAVITGASQQTSIDSNASLEFYFITSPYEYEHNFLKTDSIARLYLAYSSNAYFKPWESSTSDPRLFTYAELEKAIYKKQLPSNTISLDSALVADFSRLGRDITAEGFIHRYGTHYAHEVTYGGRFLKRYNINKEDYIYSPYDKSTFKEKLKEDIIASQNSLPDPDPYINSGRPSSFSVGGKTNTRNPKEWESTVASQSQPIDVVLIPYTQLFGSRAFPEIDNKQEKIDILESMNSSIKTEIQTQLNSLLQKIFFTVRTNLAYCS